MCTNKKLFLRKRFCVHQRFNCVQKTYARYSQSHLHILIGLFAYFCQSTQPCLLLFDQCIQLLDKVLVSRLTLLQFTATSPELEDLFPTGLMLTEEVTVAFGLDDQSCPELVLERSQRCLAPAELFLARGQLLLVALAQFVQLCLEHLLQLVFHLLFDFGG